MKKKLIGFVTICLGLVVFGFSSFTQNKSEETVRVTQGHLNEIADFSNDNILVGTAQNVFIGEVVKQKGNKSLDGAPETQFTVKIIKNLKGDLEGEVTVNQFGGYTEDENGENVLVKYNGDELLEEGQKYLLATRYLESEDWHTAISTYGTVKINDSKEMNSLIGRITSALKSPIVPEPIIDKDNYKNKEKLSKTQLENKN
jgi:hypothetical protein